MHEASMNLAGVVVIERGRFVKYPDSMQDKVEVSAHVDFVYTDGYNCILRVNVMEFQEFVEDYYKRFISALEDFDRTSLSAVLKVFEDIAISGGTLWVAGNGGSAAISDHTVCDSTKWTYVEGQPPLRSISLASNTPMITALANDYDYEDVFSRQLTYYLKPGDALLLVSSSGNSPNIIKACEYANSKGVPTVAFVGFHGGKLKEIAKYSVWVPIENYGICEDTHQSLMHVITQYLRLQAEQRTQV